MNVQQNNPRKRVPAEWQRQAAAWLLWPGRRERMHEPAFARIAAIDSRQPKLRVPQAADAVRARLGGGHCHSNDQPAS